MSAERVHRAVGPWRWLAAVSAVTGAMVFGVLPAMAATAYAVTAAASPGEQIAAALRKSPVYVDPSLSSAFPPAVRASLLQQIRKAPAPVFILAVPLVSGGEWASGDQLATVVHDDLGRAGIYLTLDAEFGSDIKAYTWPSDPQGIDAPPYHAADAAQAVNLSQDMQNAVLPQKFVRCIGLVSDGHAVSAYAAALRQLDRNAPTTAPSGRPRGTAASGRPRGGGTGWLVIAVVVIAVIVAGAGGWLVVRRRGRRPSPFVTPHSVFAAARTATESELRAQVQQQVIELGELVEQPGPLAAAGADGPQSERAQEQVARALDAYQAAGKVFDSASGLCDLAGVLVLVHLGRGAAAAAEALQVGRPAPATLPLCFFSPLHGEGMREIHWRALGERETLDVHVCQECAAAAAQHRLPDVLVDDAGGQPVPYYEVDRERSVWAATGYGQFGSDLIQRILTRGAHPTR